MPYAVGKKMLQFQSGLIYGDIDGINPSYTLEGFTFGIQGRYGLLESLEIRSSASWSSESIISQGETYKLGGISFLNLGARVNFIDGNGASPSLGLDAEIRMQNIGPPEYQIDQPAPRVLVLYNMPLLKHFLFTTNFGLTWDNFNDHPFGSYTLNLSTNLREEWSVFVESYANLFANTTGSNFNAGAAYLVSKDLQLDLFFNYYGIHGYPRGWGLNAGVSLRLDLQKG